jgi:hypothetical protein
MPAKKRHLQIAGLRVRTFKLPPRGFDVLKASDRELSAHGFPRRPDPVTEAGLHKKWVATYARPLRHITPRFGRMKNVRHGPAKTGSQRVEGPYGSNNWSGAIVNAPAGDSITWVNGVWTVPNPQSTQERCDGNWYYSSAWIGIDGICPSQDVLQAGTEHDEVCAGGQTQTSFYAWWEWLPGDSVKITNFPVAIGDAISCLICAGSSTSAEIYFTNQTQNIHTALGASTSGATSLIGNCAEWIVERLTLGNVLQQLADYGEVDFTGCIAGTAKSAAVYAEAGTPVVMYDDYCDQISIGTITGPEQVKCVYQAAWIPPLYAAWKGVNSDQGIYYAGFNGSFFLPQQVVPGAGTSVGPALTMFEGTPYMAWKGAGNDQGIYYAFLDGHLWDVQGKIPGVGTSYRPALAVLNGVLYMAWKGVSGDAGIYYSWFDGNPWVPQTKITGVGTSGGVALAEFNGKLYMAWKGVGNDQGIYYSYFDGTGWAAQTKVPGVGTSAGPSLAPFLGTLFMAWKGVKGDQSIWYSSLDGHFSWVGQQQVPGVGTSVGPALTRLNCALFMTWKGSGSDQGIWFTNFALQGTGCLTSPRYLWSPQQKIINVGSFVGPALASLQ